MHILWTIYIILTRKQCPGIWKHKYDKLFIKMLKYECAYKVTKSEKYKLY